MDKKYEQILAEARSLLERIGRGSASQREQERISAIRAEFRQMGTTLEDAVAGGTRGGSGGSTWTGGFGEFLNAVKVASSDSHFVDPRLVRPRGAATGLSESIGSDGGFLADQEVHAALLSRVYTGGQIASRVTKVPIGPNKNGLKTNAIDETSRATGSRWGGVRGFWQGEAAEKIGSKPKFRRMEMELVKLTGYVYTTDELLEDAVALPTILEESFGDEILFETEAAIFSGSGVGRPLGFMASNALITVPKEQGQLARTLVVENIVNMWSRLSNGSGANAVWLVNQDVIPQLYTMGVSVGVGGVPVFMPAGGISGAPYNMILGRPVLQVEQAETVGTLGDIVLVDLSQYLVIDRPLKSASSIHVRFLWDECCFKFTYRVQGQPIPNAPLAPYKGSATTSPFVALATRA